MKKVISVCLTIVIIATIVVSVVLAGQHYLHWFAINKIAPTDNNTPDPVNPNYNVTTYVNVSIFDIECTNVPSITQLDIDENIARTNEILMRSNATFQLRFQSVEIITKMDCSLSKDDLLKASVLSQLVSSKADERNLKVLVIKIVNNNEAVRTKGFSVTGSFITFVDTNEMKEPTYTFTHEMGHAFGLDHPFNEKGIAYGDLPPACATSETRVFQLVNCPEVLRTCGGSRNEDLTNVMDYLPERCGKKYHFSPYQIQFMKKRLFQ